MAREIQAQREQIFRNIQLPRRLIMFTFGDRAADYHFILPAITLRQQGDPGQKGDVKRAFGFFSEPFQSLGQTLWKLEWFRRSLAVPLGRSKMVERQLEPLQLAGKLTPPVLQIRAAAFGRIDQGAQAGGIQSVGSSFAWRICLGRNPLTTLGQSSFPAQGISPFMSVAD